MSALVDQNDAYKAVKIIRVDWDTHSNSDIVNELAVTQRSTLVMFNEGNEVARVVADASEDAIRSLFDQVTAQ